MTKEQETLKYLSGMRVIDFDKLGFVYGKETIDDVLKLIQQLQKETEKYKQLYNRVLSDLVVANKNNLDKDKMIALMAEHIVSSAIVDDTVCAIKFCEIEEDCTHEKMLNCTKQYFKKKAQEIK